MKKNTLNFTVVLLFLNMLFNSCTKEVLETNSISGGYEHLEKDYDVKRYGFIACLIDDPSCSSGMGMRCTTNNSGGCKRNSSCECAKSLYIDKAFAIFELELHEWDGYAFPTDNPEWNQLMWEKDSTLAVHPDSL